MKNETIDPKVLATAKPTQPELTAEDVGSIADLISFIEAKVREIYRRRSTTARRGERGAK